MIISQLNNTTPDGYNVPITNVTVLSTQDTEIDHLPAVAITFTATIGFIDEKSVFYLTQSGQNVYLFGGEATVATFDQDQAAWTAVLGTVSITTAGLAT
ncbi:MAG: hypothetical protein M0Z41_17780 [Peptococcaceae bacterium]|nr:hypothetical protein [Peptococcaceae bacterium]